MSRATSLQIIFAFVMGFALLCYITSNPNYSDTIITASSSHHTPSNIPVDFAENNIIIHRKLYGCCGCPNAGRSCWACCKQTTAKNVTA